MLNEILNKIFRIVMPKYNYAPREGQIRLAHQILSSLRDRNVSLCEAEVGTGKTHAYIISAVLNSKYNENFDSIRQIYPVNGDYYKSTTMPVVIATSSIALQNAIINYYVPEISKILMTHKIIDKPISAVIRKGKSHYVCDLRLHDYLKKFPANKEPAVYSVLHTLSKFNNIDLDLQDTLSSYTKRRICVPKECNPLCSKYKECRYAQLTGRLNNYEHDIQICNHGLFLADIQKRIKTGKSIIPNYQAVIIDEAHKFLDAAGQSYGVTISRTEFKDITTCILSLKIIQEKLQNKVKSYCDSIVSGADKLFESIMNEFRTSDAERFNVKISNARYLRIKSLIDDFQIILTTLEKSDLKGKTQLDLCFTAKGMITDMRDRLKIYANKRDYIHWLEVPKDLWNTKGVISLHCIPKELNTLLYRDLWSKRIPFILTSGTLSLGGDFSYIKQKLGIDLTASNRIDEITTPSPFNYKKNMLMFLDDKVPFPDSNNEQYIKILSDKIEKLINATHGHTAVLFTSYRVMELVRINLRIGNFPLISMDKGAINPIEAFKKSGNGVLFAAGSCREGIDIPGDILSSLIIVKLPFPTPDSISEYEQTLFDDDEKFKKEVVTSEMLMKLKQGAGRLIRHENDVGVLTIIDSRLEEGNFYREKVISALPDCRIAKTLSEVEDFIKAEKPDEYFK